MSYPVPQYNADDYLTPEIAEALPILDYTCAMFTQNHMIEILAAQIKTWVMGDPELADIIVEGKKKFDECVRYVLENASIVAKTQVNAMTAEQIKALAQQEIHGRTASMVGVGVTDEQVFGWAKEYLTDPNKKPSDVKKPVRKGAAKSGSQKGGNTKGTGATGAKTKTTTGTGSSAAAAPGANASKEGAVVEDKPEQISLFSASNESESAA